MGYRGRDEAGKGLDSSISCWGVRTFRGSAVAEECLEA